MKENSLKGMIGLEIHTYLVTKEKLFCKCKSTREKGVRANTFICPICTGQPGAKPMLPNKSAIEKATQIGLMLGCKINEILVWNRKHYSWPDLPKGYQNTMSGGRNLSLGLKGKFGGVNILSMHLEEDPASWEPSTGKVDYNRSGLPLVEIVTAPDFESAEEVVEWIQKLVHNLNYLKIVDGDAGIKVDVNVNIPGKSERVEVKNLNSFENIQRAINYELIRQGKEGGKFKETRRFDDKTGKTSVMRSKEDAEDYRFIRDPDLKDVVLNDKFIDEIKENIPESPDAKLEKLISKYKVDSKNAEILAKNLDVVEFYEKVSDKIDAKFALPWVTVELLRVLNYNKANLDSVKIEPEHFVELLNLVKNKRITELQAKDILNKFYPKSFMPKAEGKIIDSNELNKVIDEVTKKEKKAVEDYKAGDSNALNYLMGAIMKATNKRADFAVARKLLIEKLG